MSNSRSEKARSAKLGERRTVLVEMPDARPIIDASIYQMRHEVCVPGGWESVAEMQLIAPDNLAGIYGPAGQMLANPVVRRQAAGLFDDATATLLKTHPYQRLSELVSKVQLQEGTGEVGGWDDPGVAVAIADLLRDLIA